MGIQEQIDIARGILAGQDNRCAECGKPLRFEDATKRSHSFDVICRPCYSRPRADMMILDEATDWQPKEREPMRPHYFDQDSADSDDWQLKMAIAQGYVPSTCLLGGPVVMSEMNAGRDPCAGCEGPRVKCHGRPKRSEETL